MTNTGISFTVKDWFANKVAQEVKMNINMCDVFGILKESEKAVYAVLNLGCRKHKTMWIPKSVLIENAIGEDATGHNHYETKRFDSYDEAMQEFTYHWNMFD